MECLTKILKSFSHRVFLQKYLCQIFDRVLNMPLYYLSCFAMVLRMIHRKVDICQIDHSIHSELRIFSYSDITHGSKTFKLTKGQQRLKRNNQLLNLMFLFFHFLCSNVPDNKCHKQKQHVLFFTCFKLVACVLVCTRAIAHIKWKRLHQ